MPRRHSEVADIGFSLHGLSSDLQDVTKQQQKTVRTRVQFAAALQQCTAYGPMLFITGGASSLPWQSAGGNGL